LPRRTAAAILIPTRAARRHRRRQGREHARRQHQAGHPARHRRTAGRTYEEFSLEGYGPGGVAVLLDINTDNRNRTVSEIRHCFGKNGGNMAEAGAVSWMFHKKGDIIIPKTAAKEDDLMNIVLEAGGEDLNDDGENWEILTEPSATRLCSKP
jgi:transcriptional/translational regulatory protein YebC/TACO1